MVDAKHFSAYKENSTAKYQLGGANIIVLNKTDLVDDSEALAVENVIREIKDKYNIKNTMTGKPIFNHYVIHRAENGLVNKEVFEGVYRLEEVLKFAEDFSHHDHTAKDSLGQKVVYLKNDCYFADVDAVLQNMPVSIYRVKGVVKVKDVPQAIVVNYAFGDVTFEELDVYEGKSLLILIGENIEADVEELCQKFGIPVPEETSLHSLHSPTPYQVSEYSDESEQSTGSDFEEEVIKALFWVARADVLAWIRLCRS